MSDIRSKVAYLRGLAEGLDIEVSSAEGRVLSSIIDVLDEMAEEISEVHVAQEELVEYVEDVDYDLGELEETVFECEEPEVEFVPDGLMLSEEDGVHLESCPQCGEVLAASYGVLDDTEFNHRHDDH